jgi:hypothetical protein
MWRVLWWFNWRVAVVVVVVLFITVGMTALLVGYQKRPLNMGLGPEWTCYRTLFKAPACIRDKPNGAGPLLYSN